MDDEEFFPIAEPQIESNEAFAIATEYKTIFWGCANRPIVWTGRNAAGLRVVGSLAGDSERLRSGRSFWALTSEGQYSRLLSGEVTLRQVYEHAVAFFVTDDPYTGSRHPAAIWSTTFAVVPEDWRPTVDSYLPKENES